MDDLDAEAELIPPDVRRPRKLLDSRVQKDGELSDSDDEGEGDRRDHASHRDRPLMEAKSSFRIGVENLAAGPSGHTTVARLLSQMDSEETGISGEDGTGTGRSSEDADVDMDSS